MNAMTMIALAVMGLVGAGLYGLLITRNLIKVVIALQILVKGALLALVAAGQASEQVNLGQSLAVTVIVADTIVAVVGLGWQFRPNGCWARWMSRRCPTCEGR